MSSRRGDAAAAIGAAFSVWHQSGGKRTFVMDHANWGPQFSSTTSKELLGRSKPALQRRVARSNILTTKPEALSTERSGDC